MESAQIRLLLYMIYTRSRLKTYYINLNIQYFCSCRVNRNEPLTCHNRNFESRVHVTTPFKGLQNNIFLGDFQLTGKPWDNILWRWRDLDVQRATFAYRRVYRFMECEPFWNTMVLTHLNAKATNLYQFWVAHVSLLWNHPRVSCGFFSSIVRSLATQIRHIYKSSNAS